MPLYFYHLKFELYCTPDSIGSGEEWVPRDDESIFDDLPSHRKSTNHSKRRNEVDDDTPFEGDNLVNIAEDWRFGRVSIETLDPVAVGGMATSESSRTGAGAAAAPTLGPSFAGSGTATKAKYIPIEPKNTELGWGVVHFYREDEQTQSLRLPQPGNELAASAVESQEDCSTLCIPAVPAYMSPGDFMGFVGERWHTVISHCRLVMTSKMNRYLVLLKFRDNKSAKEWKRQFDGKVFNTMEVRMPLCYEQNSALTTDSYSCSHKFVTSFLSSPSRSTHPRYPLKTTTFPPHPLQQYRTA